MRAVFFFVPFAAAFLLMSQLRSIAQSADWQEVVWREPQTRYLLADMTLGGSTKLYRDLE